MECKICAHRAHTHTFNVDLDLIVQFGVHFFGSVREARVCSTEWRSSIDLHALSTQKSRWTASRTLGLRSKRNSRRDTSRHREHHPFPISGSFWGTGGVRNGRRRKAVGGSGSWRTLRTGPHRRQGCDSNIGQTGTAVEPATRRGILHICDSEGREVVASL